MWEEALGPGVSVENTQDWDFFMKYQLQQMYCWKIDSLRSCLLLSILLVVAVALIVLVLGQTLIYCFFQSLLLFLGMR